MSIFNLSSSVRSLAVKALKNNIKTLFIVLSIFASSSFAHPNHASHIGHINFPTSGNKQAQTCFERGVLYLHSFEYKEAREEFQQAIKRDPNFTMAYWGEAMTLNHPLWQEQDYSGAQKILNQLAPSAKARIEKAKSPKEKGFINAINLLYGAGDKKTRDANYAKAMHQLYQRYPDDDEIALFYALSLLGSTEGERDIKTYMLSASVSEKVYAHNKNHPGVLHYLIHAYDDPDHGKLGLPAAKAYAKVAPDASHALHMPSHIFLALGLWDDVITSNKAAWESGLKQNPTRDPALFTQDDLHALQWLAYGYLQKLQFKAAYQATKTMYNIALKTQSPMSKWYYAIMRAAYVTTTHDWQTDLPIVDMTGIELSAQASNLYADGVIALNKTPADINSAKNSYVKLIKIIPHNVSQADTHLDYFTSIIPSGVQATKIMAFELAAQIKLTENDKESAIKLLEQAVHLENKMAIGYGPPIPVESARELRQRLSHT